MGARRLLAVAALVIFVHGCGAGLPLAPTYPAEDPGFRDAGPVVPEGMADEEPDALRVLPGDIVTLLLVSEDTTEYKGLVVDERGLLHAPLAGDVEVGGLELTRAEAAVEQALREFDRVVRVHMVVTDLTGHRATVVGAVEEPGRVPVLPGARVADLLALAGGVVKNNEDGEPEELSDLDGARLIRDGRALPISLNLAIQGHPRHNVRARPGDQLYVPPARGRRVSVFGEVRTAGVVTWRRGLRLSEALAMAGGMSDRADVGDVRIVRGNLAHPLVYSVSVDDINDGEATDVELAPGDIVYVDDHPMADLDDFIDALGPILTLGLTFGLGYAATQ